MNIESFSDCSQKRLARTWTELGNDILPYFVIPMVATSAARPSLSFTSIAIVPTLERTEKIALCFSCQLRKSNLSLSLCNPAPRKNTRGDFPDLAASKKDCAALAARGLPLGLQRREREPGSAVHVRAHQPRTTQRTVARQTAVCAARLLSRRDRSLSTSLHSHKPRDFKNSLLADFPAS